MKKISVLFTNSSPLIKYGLRSGFDNLGHTTFVMDNEYRLWDKPKEEQVRLFAKAIEEYRPDLVFSECFANFAEEIFNYTKMLGTPHFYWSIEDTPHDHWIGDFWSDYADYIFTTTAECLPNYWNEGKQAELMLFGCNPAFHKEINLGIERDITLVANNYDRRSEQTKQFVLPLIDAGYDVSIYGNEWWLDEYRAVNLLHCPQVYKGYAAYEDLSSLYSSTKIILGQNLDKDSVTQTSMRPFESLAVGGGLLVAEYTLAMDYLFRDHVYLPRTTSEMLAMVDEIFSMSEEQRKQKAKKAQDYVYKYHNYDLRAQQVVDAFLGR